MSDRMLYAVLYLEINVMATALIAIIWHRTAGLSRMVAQRNFAMTIAAEIVFFLSDTAAVLMIAGMIPLSRIGLMAAKTVYFFSTTLMCFFWFVYFEYLQGSPFVKNRQSVRNASILVWIMGLLLIVNWFTGILFYVDPDGTYHRGPGFAIQYILSYTYVFVTCVRALVGLFDPEKRAHRKILLTLALFPVAPAGAGILQFIWPQLPLACMALSLATLIMYLNWTDDMISADPLTRLNNRKQLSYHFEHWKKNGEERACFLFLIDANKFKHINDQYGHIQGDKALIRIADALRTACQDLPNRTNIARYGGDEFVILAVTEEPEKLSRAIHERLRTINEQDPVPYELTVSIGIAKVDEKMSLTEAIAEADKQMYLEKKK